MDTEIPKSQYDLLVAEFVKVRARLDAAKGYYKAMIECEKSGDHEGAKLFKDYLDADLSGDGASPLFRPNDDLKSHVFPKPLSVWFGLSYASFAVLPRILMQAMPESWQNCMASLLDQYDKSFPNQPKLGIQVRACDPSTNKLIPMPKWLYNYNRPDQEKIDACRPKDGE